MTMRRGMRLLSTIPAALALSACGPKPAPSADAPSLAEVAAQATAPPDILADQAAAARTPRNQPNFRICLQATLTEGDFAPLDVPAGVIFISWGRKKGDERNPSLVSNMLEAGAVRYVVVLDRAVTLAKAAPCAETIAQAATSMDFQWRMPLVRQSQDLQFQVTGVEDHMAWPLTDRLGDLVKKGAIFGYRPPTSAPPARCTTRARPPPTSSSILAADAIGRKPPCPPDTSSIPRSSP
jgi:hypothetical protein